MTPRNRKEHCAVAAEFLSRAVGALCWAAATDGTPDSLAIEQRLADAYADVGVASKHLLAALGEKVSFP